MTMDKISREMGYVSVQEFVEKWNTEEHKVEYTLIQNCGAPYPSTIEARFPIQSGLYTLEWFMNFSDQITRKSPNTLFAVTDKYLFEKGILDLKVSSKSRSCKTYVLIDTMKWLEDNIFL